MRKHRAFLDCRQSNFEAAEGLGKQIRFPNGIRSRNSLPARKTASFKAFKLMELVCLFLCFNKSKTCFRLRVPTYLFIIPNSTSSFPSAPVIAFRTTA